MKERYPGEGLSTHGGPEAGGDLWEIAGSSLCAVRDGHSCGGKKMVQIRQGSELGHFWWHESDLHFHSVGSKVSSKGFKPKK